MNDLEMYIGLLCIGVLLILWRLDSIYSRITELSSYLIEQKIIESEFRMKKFKEGMENLIKVGRNKNNVNET